MPDMRGSNRFHDPEYDESIKRGAAGCIFLARSTGRILLAFRSRYVEMPHHWGGFGGAIDQGETPDQAVRREIREEAGYNGSYALRPIYRFVSATFTYSNFLAVVEEEFQPQLNWENEDARWFDPAELPSPLHPGMKMCLDSPITLGVLSEEIAKLNLSEDASSLRELAPKGAVDPALLTHKEFVALSLDRVPEERQWHSESAYQTDLASLNEYRRIEDFPRLIQRFKKNGLEFTVRLQEEKNRWTRHDQNGEIMRDEAGQAMYFTDEEVVALGRPLKTYELGIFNDKNQCVASFQDEWGCNLVMVASEYKGMGLGPLLTKLGLTIYPNKSSGGFTPGGRKAFLRAHKMFVSEALRNGLYRRLLQDGKITVERVKEITASVGIDHKPAEPETDLSSNPKDWLLYADQYGCFIIYDRKLPHLLNDERFSYFADNMVKGIIYVAPGEKYGIVNVYGGETKAIRQFLLRCALAFCEKNGVTMVLDREDFDDVDERTMNLGTTSLQSGFWRAPLTATKPIDYRSMVQEEHAFRRSFDRYEEFRYQMMEFAYAKFDQP